MEAVSARPQALRDRRCHTTRRPGPGTPGGTTSQLATRCSSSAPVLEGRRPRPLPSGRRHIRFPLGLPSGPPHRGFAAGGGGTPRLASPPMTSDPHSRAEPTAHYVLLVSGPRLGTPDWTGDLEPGQPRCKMHAVPPCPSRPRCPQQAGGGRHSCHAARVVCKDSVTRLEKYTLPIRGLQLNDSRHFCGGEGEVM